MTGLNQVPSDYKKLLDQTLHLYQAKKMNIIPLFNEIPADSGITTPEYVREIQTYDASKGWTAYDDPIPLADGARTTVDGIGTEDATGTVATYSKGFRLDRKLLKSNNQLIKQQVARHTVEKADIIRNYVNRTLITNMASNAGQSYSASNTWSTTGDAVADVNSIMENFRLQSGGMEADFLAIHPNEFIDLKNDDRFQNSLYTTEKPIETGRYPNTPFGLDIIVDQSITTGSFFAGKKGMFGDIVVTEKFDSYEFDEAEAGKVFSMVYSFIDQYKLPYMLMYGTGI